MPDKCVFLDRDGTIIEDPGYLTDPDAVRLLPGVGRALRSLRQAGYRLVVVTNQSAVARGMLTEEDLDRIHAEMRRQLAEREAHIDAIYHCPYHPEGTIEEYARESLDRKPQPGMLLKAQKDLDLDLTGSWMVGDSPADIEAGQRAGCRTVRLRTRGESVHGEDEDVQADHTVRNMVDAARVILRGPERAREAASTAAGIGGPDDAAGMTDSQVLREILHHVRRLTAGGPGGQFSTLRLAGAIAQVLALIGLVVGLVFVPGATDSADIQRAHRALVAVHVSMLSAIALQLVAMTAFLLSRRR